MREKRRLYGGHICAQGINYSLMDKYPSGIGPEILTIYAICSIAFQTVLHILSGKDTVEVGFKRPIIQGLLHFLIQLPLFNQESC